MCFLLLADWYIVMKWPAPKVRKHSATVFALAVVLALTGSEHRAISQSIPVSAQSDRVGVPYDWSHRHQVFSQPASAAERRVIERDPRYWQQMNRTLHASSMRMPDHPASIPRSLGGGALGAASSGATSLGAASSGAAGIGPGRIAGHEFIEFQ